MNRLITSVFLLTILIAQPILSQEGLSKGVSTKIRASLSEKGRVFIKDFFSLGTIKGNIGCSMEISALVLYEPGKESERLRGLKINIISDSTEKRVANVYLDYDETDNLSKVVVYMIQAADAWKYSTKDSSEVTFITKDNFRFGFYQKAMQQVCFAEYSIMRPISGYFDIEDLKTVKLMLDKAKAILSVK